MISLSQTARATTFLAFLSMLAACGGTEGAGESSSAVIDPPSQCASNRPDCSLSEDFPEPGELDASNSAGIRFSEEQDALVIDRVSALPDVDDDGVPDDADDCPGTPDWRTCDDDPTNDGLYATLFYDPDAAIEARRTRSATTTADIPRVDVYFLIDATPTLDEEITALKGDILTVIDSIRLVFGDAQFGVGLYRAYPLTPYAAATSQSPYHHVLDVTDDDALIETAIGSLNTVANTSRPTAATQALFSTASGLGLGDMVPNRSPCPDSDRFGYPCFRPDALHIVMNITDARVYNGPEPGGDEYTDPPFSVGVGDGVIDLPPVEMFPDLFTADDAVTALDLGNLSGSSVTLMGMSTGLDDLVQTSVAPGCDSPPDPPEGDNMDGKDAVVTFQLDGTVTSASAFADNTHWPGANVALFDSPLLDPAMALACDDGTIGVGMWGAIGWTPTAAQYYLVVDGIIPADTPGFMPEGAFSLSIVHDGDPANGSWLTADAPVSWTDVESALLSRDIRVASVVTPESSTTIPSDGNLDARLIALVTEAITKGGELWVNELPAANGDGLDAAVISTINLAYTDSVYDIRLDEVDDESTTVDERDLVRSIRWGDCKQGEPLECGWGSGRSCRRCDLGTSIDFEVVFANDTVAPTATSQVFELELLSRAESHIDIERIPVRVLVPDDLAHQFDAAPEASFYRNAYDSTARCVTPPERPKWGDLTWEGDTPGDTTIEFQIRTAPTVAELATAVPATVVIPTDTDSRVLNLTDELIADNQPYGLPYIEITAVLNPSVDPPATPVLKGWTFEFVCEAAE